MSLIGLIAYAKKPSLQSAYCAYALVSFNRDFSELKGRRLF